MKLLYIDLFCGAGGTSTGVNLARVNGEDCARVIACVNHDEKAIASHASNHSDAMHFTEDIRTLELTPLVNHLKRCRMTNPDAFVVLWASLECTNFSKAKGGQPRDADSRTLAEYLFRYIEAINPDFIQIENVEEFMSWGDVDASGKPISMDKGKAYCRWIRNVRKYGYNFEHRILNAADFGAYTSRKRFFGIFAKKGLPITFPEATHAKKPEASLFGSLKRWKPVKEVLDFTDEGRSIFFREKLLSEKTLERIYAGLIKFVAGGKDKFMVKYNSMSQSGKYQAPSVDDPCPVVATQNRLAIAQVSFISKQFGGHPQSKNVSIDEPAAGALTANPKHKLVTVNQDSGSYEIPIFPDDSPMTIKIKQFMSQYGITDIKMRMLKISELKLIMGFPEDYILIGNQTEQKKFIGNAVEVNMARVLCEALYKSLTPMFSTKAAI
jgi:DNA (cytosine-5)-methyltransferase 1